MLSSICSGCGQACSPDTRECPTCTAPPAATQAAVSQELLSLAHNFESASSVAVLAPPLAAASPTPQEEPEPALSDKLAPLGSLAWIPVGPGLSRERKLTR